MANKLLLWSIESIAYWWLSLQAQLSITILLPGSQSGGMLPSSETCRHFSLFLVFLEYIWLMHSRIFSKYQYRHVTGKQWRKVAVEFRIVTDWVTSYMRQFVYCDSANFYGSFWNSILNCWDTVVISYSESCCHIWMFCDKTVTKQVWVRAIEFNLSSLMCDRSRFTRWPNKWLLQWLRILTVPGRRGGDLNKWSIYIAVISNLPVMSSGCMCWDFLFQIFSGRHGIWCAIGYKRL